MPNNQYEWFKGPQANKDKKNWKGNLKVTWKFTRIFLFFSLFFFSMWGCVQTFTSKTSTQVGQGVEITADRNTISPQITKLKVNSDPKKNIYTFDLAKQNDLLYGYDNDTYDKMVKSYEAKFGRRFNLDEALAGGNNIAVLSHSDSKINDTYVADKDGLAVATTIFNKDKVKTTQITSGDLMPRISAYLKKFKYVSWDWDKRFVQITDPNKYVQSIDISKLWISLVTGQVLKSNNQPLKSLQLQSKSDVGKWINNESTAPYSTQANDGSVIDVKAHPEVNLLTKPFKNWNQIYNLNLANAILNDFDIVMKKTPESLIPKTSGKISSNVQTIIKNIRANQLFNTQLFNLAFKGTDARKDNAINWKLENAAFTKQFELIENNYAYNQSKNYRPIATWGQSFQMGRGSGPFYGIFVYPIAWVTDKITNAFPIISGWESFVSIVLVVVIISMITFALSFKGTLQQQKMTELNSKKAVIEAKYEGYKGNKQMENRKRQEVSELYKKEGINPLASLGTMFITMPFFLAMWRTIGTNQHIKGTVWLGINFAATSWRELFAGNFVYLPLLAIAAGTNILSQIYPKLLTKRRDKNRINVHQKAAMKKSNKTQTIMMFAFTFITLIFTAGLQVYFIVRSLWRIGESTLTHKIIVHQKKRNIKIRK